MAKLGAKRHVTHEPAGANVAEAAAQAEPAEAPLTDTERRAPAMGSAPTTAIAGGGYRRVFACATGSLDAPNEEPMP